MNRSHNPYRRAILKSIVERGIRARFGSRSEASNDVIGIETLETMFDEKNPSSILISISFFFSPLYDLAATTETIIESESSVFFFINSRRNNYS